MKDEVEKFLVKAKKSIDASMLLYEHELYDDASSRAYYAMHHAAKAALLMKNIDIKSHKALISKFGESYIKLGGMDKETAKTLSFGFRLRMKSDYDSEFELDKDEV